MDRPVATTLSRLKPGAKKEAQLASRLPCAAPWTVDFGGGPGLQQFLQRVEMCLDLLL